MGLSRLQEVGSIEKMRNLVLFISIIVFSAALRLHYIEDRPVHTDEAENAYLLGKHLNGEHYQFSPTHHHGPTLNYTLLLPMKWIGKQSFHDLKIKELRLILTATGLLTLAVLWMFRNITGDTAALISAGLMGISPLLVYYNNYVIHETLLGLFSLLFILSTYHYIRTPSWQKTFTAGVLAGLLFSTKITSSILFLSWAIALGVIFMINSPKITSPINDLKDRFIKHSLLTISGFFLPVITLYSSFFQNWKGPIDAFLSIFQYHTETGHEKPWSYFFETFVFPNFSKPFYTHESLLWLLTLAGTTFAIIGIAKSKQTKHSFIFTLIISVIVQFFIYSALSYKTPWLMLVTWLHLCLIAGYGFQELWKRFKKWQRFPFLFALGLGVALQVKSTDIINGRFHSDVRNPLAYSPTSSSITNLNPFIREFNKNEEIHVIGKFIWPIPWYLRELENVKYFEQVKDSNIANILILTDNSYPSLKENLADQYMIYPYTLRPNFPVYLCINKNLVTP